MKNKIVTLDFLTTKGACVEGLAWFEAKYGEKEVGLKQLITDLQAEDKLEWINCLLTHIFTKKQCVMYAVYAAANAAHAAAVAAVAAAYAAHAANAAAAADYDYAAHTSAAANAAHAAGAAANEAMHKITDYGIKLLEEEE